MTPFAAATLALSIAASAQGDDAAGEITLNGRAGVQAVFGHTAHGWNLVAYLDVDAGIEWRVAGPGCSLQTSDGTRTTVGPWSLGPVGLGPGNSQTALVLHAELRTPPVDVRRRFSFCDDGRTVRIQTSLRSTGAPLTISRVGLLELAVAGERFRLTGPELVSLPVFGDRVFAGVEHPVAWCQADGDRFWLAQHSHVAIGAEWTELPAAVLGSASEEDFRLAGSGALRRAFLRYLDTVRVMPRDTHIHYNNWWTMPVPFSEADVLANIADLRQGLYDGTGFFFDSYAMDMGWSDPHEVWQVNRAHYPEGFTRIRDALAAVGARPGLWVSPSSLYPPALDNAWLEASGYEVGPHPSLGRFACLAVGGRYQRAFLGAVLKHVREAGLGHVKFDGFVSQCDAPDHGHPPGPDSRYAIAQGLIEVFDAAREADLNIALEPTCFGYNPSPWWLMHTPFLIGPFGDDSPWGRCPAPDWLEAMTTGRDVENLRGRDSFLLPTSALECFDVVVQCPGDFENHAVMAVGRGRWFYSCYINPAYVSSPNWRFFADLMRWARANRWDLVEPVPFGGRPEQREPYGYAFLGPRRHLFCIRNPWIEEADIALPSADLEGTLSELRVIYPRRQVLRRVPAGEEIGQVRLGPYETAFLELAPTRQISLAPRTEPHVAVEWMPVRAPRAEKVVYAPVPEPLGPSWTSEEGDAQELLVFEVEGVLTVADGASAELCILCEGTPEAAQAKCFASVDGAPVVPSISTSEGAFAATGAPQPEHWVWFLVPMLDGAHDVAVRVTIPSSAAVCGVFVRGTQAARGDARPSHRGVAFPLPSDGARRSWSRTIVPLTAIDSASAPVRRQPRRPQHIDGLFLDALQWVEATAGWGEVTRNRSVMGRTMHMGGAHFVRGIGTHANSRIVWDLPEGFATFAATIGYDREVSAGSIVFVVEGDGQELYRSQVFRFGTSPEAIEVPIAGVRRLALVLEDAGDGIIADHGNWANARILRM